MNELYSNMERAVQTLYKFTTRVLQIICRIDDINFMLPE